jgi:hypothetical protein
MSRFLLLIFDGNELQWYETGKYKQQESLAPRLPCPVSHGGVELKGSYRNHSGPVCILRTRALAGLKRRRSKKRETNFFQVSLYVYGK